MPSTLALGVLNSGKFSFISPCVFYSIIHLFKIGFISTQAGTAGRAVGNFSTSITGSLGDIENFTYIPITIWIILALSFVLFKYGDLYVTSIRRVLKERKRN